MWYVQIARSWIEYFLKCVVLKDWILLSINPNLSFWLLYDPLLFPLSLYSLFFSTFFPFLRLLASLDALSTSFEALFIASDNISRIKNSVGFSSTADCPTSASSIHPRSRICLFLKILDWVFFKTRYVNFSKLHRQTRHSTFLLGLSAFSHYHPHYCLANMSQSMSHMCPWVNLTRGCVSRTP